MTKFLHFLARRDTVLLLALTLGVMSVFTGCVLFVQARQAREDRTAYTYRVGDPMPDRVCAGRAIRIPIHYTVRRVPLTIHVDDEIRDARTGRVVLPDYRPAYDRSYVNPFSIDTFLVFTPSVSLLPGEYDYIVVSSAEGTDPAGFSVRFTIKSEGECGRGKDK